MARNNEIDIDDIDDNEPDAPAQLREAYKRANARAAKADQLERENALMRAGIDLSTRLGQAFAATYAGDLSDVEAIKADALDFSPTIVRGNTVSDATATTTATGETTPPATPEPTGTAERSALVDGAIPSGAAPEDVLSASTNRAKELIGAGQSEEVGIGEFIAMRARGLAEGKIAAVPS